MTSTTAATPVVSVIMPVYNAARYVAAAVESVLVQSFTDFEFIITDDGSTDDSLNILRYYTSDARLILRTQEHQGHLPPLNHGWQQARGRYVARMDADDISLPERFAKQVAYLETHPAVAVVGGAARILTDKGLSQEELRYPAEPAAVREALLDYSPLVHPAVMMRREALAAVGGYRLAFSQAEDYDLWLRLSDSFDLANLEDIVLYYRVHPEQISVQSACQQVMAMLGAQASASSRRRFGKDAAADVATIDFVALLKMGMPRTQIESGLLKLVGGRARNLLREGSPDVAWNLINKLSKIIKQHGSRDGKAALALLAARASFLQGMRWHGLAWAGEACILRPRYLILGLIWIAHRLAVPKAA